jgi:phosphoglycolate phosphatase-like HAD superfamily hydrolase
MRAASPPAASTRLVMFDVDGTLVDSNGFDAVCYAQAVRDVLDVDVDQTWASYRNVTDSGILEEILARGGFETGVDALRGRVKKRFIELTRAYVSRPSFAVREIPGASALIEALVLMPGVSVAIATGGWQETAALKLESAGIRTHGLALATGSDAPERTAIMQLAERRALRGAAVAAKTYFGDGAWDKRASAQLGYRFIGIGAAVRHDIRFEDYRDREAILQCLRR